MDNINLNSKFEIILTLLNYLNIAFELCTLCIRIYVIHTLIQKIVLYIWIDNIKITR